MLSAKLRLTSAVPALHNAAIIRESSISQTLEILFRVCGPAFFQVLAVRFVREIESSDILAIQLTLKIDERKDIEGLLFLS